MYVYIYIYICVYIYIYIYVFTETIWVAALVNARLMRPRGPRAPESSHWVDRSPGRPPLGRLCT